MFINNLEHQDPNIVKGIDEAFQRNIKTGLGKAGLGDALGQEVADAKETGEIEEFDEFAEERIKTREKYDGRNLAKEIRTMSIDETWPVENIRQLISKVLHCRPDQISFTQEEALSGNNIVYHYGSLDLTNIKSTENLILPLSIHNGIGFGGLKSAEGLVLPQSVGVGVLLQGLESIKDLDLSNIKIGGSIYLSKDIFKKHKKELIKKYPNLAKNFKSYGI